MRNTTVWPKLLVTALTALTSACAGSSGGAPPPLAYEAAVGDVEREVLGALSSRPGVRLAVMPLEAEGDVARAVGELLVDELAARLSRGSAVTVVERDKLQAVIAEMALQQSGLVRESDQIEMGKLAGAQTMLAVRATLVGEAVSVSLRVVDVETGTNLGGAALSIDYDERLRAVIADRAARLNVRSSQPVLAALGQVHAGDLAAAEEVFEPLSKEQGERRSVGLMGLAAVAHGRGDAARALELCDLSRKESNAPSYCWVIESRIAYERGDLERAVEGASRALNDAGTLLDWQKAAAANTLGLVHMAKKEPDAALTFYDKATQLDPANAEAMSNKARLLEERGDLAAAVALYQRGLKATPDDKVLALLLRDAEMRLAFAEDKARQEKIASLAHQLVTAAAAKAPPLVTAAKDEWTSTPLSLTLLPWNEKGMPARRLGETAFLESSVRNALGERPGTTLVDRELLTQVLQEMQLNSSALGDAKKALEVGKIVAARLLVDGSVVRMEGEAQVTLKLIETETTRVLGTVSTIYESGARTSEVARELEDKLGAKLRELFPLRGRVLERRGKRVAVNLGSRHGAQLGQAFTFLAPAKDDALGRGKIVELGEERCWVELEGGANPREQARARAD